MEVPQNQINIPMEEMAQVSFQKDIQIAMLMKQNKELQQLVNSLSAGVVNEIPKKQTAVQPDKQV